MFLSEKGKDRRCLYEDGDEEDLSLSQLHVLNKKYGHLVKGDSDIHPTTTSLSDDHMSNVQTVLDDSVLMHSDQDNLHPGDFIEYYALLLFVVIEKATEFHRFIASVVKVMMYWCIQPMVMFWIGFKV